MGGTEQVVRDVTFTDIELLLCCGQLCCGNRISEPFPEPVVTMSGITKEFCCIVGQMD